MDSEPYLIAHKVRGAPALDIAVQMHVGEEVWWIIPTSGHRAYPYWHESLQGLTIEMLPDGNIVTTTPAGEHLIPFLPNNWPDHYAINDKVKPKLSVIEQQPTTLEELI